MVYNNFGCIESIALLYTLLSVFITGGYIGYNLIKDYYKSKISQEYTKKDMSAYSPYYVMHIKIKNLQNYVVNQDIVEHTKIIEQITANLLFKFNGVYGMSSYNNIYILLSRNENMTYSIDKDEIFNNISDTIINNLEEIKNLSVGVYIKNVDIDKHRIGEYFNHVIYQNKFKFMKYLAKKSDVKITYNRNINPHNTKYMNKYFVKYLEQTRIDYITNPVYATHYKCVSDNQVIIFKSELSNIFNNKSDTYVDIDDDIYIDIDNDEFFIEDMIEESCIVVNHHNYDIHYLYNKDSEEDLEESEESEKSEKSEKSEESNTNNDNNNDSLEYYNCRVSRDIDINFSSNVRASSVQDALMKTYNIMCNMSIPNAETLKYEICGNTYMVHQSHFGNNKCHQFILIEQTSNGNSSGESSGESSGDMPPLTGDESQEISQERLNKESENNELVNAFLNYFKQNQIAIHEKLQEQLKQIITEEISQVSQESQDLEEEEVHVGEDDLEDID
jgi:hypothetical protein